ncbi:ELWxxDGT repeat protein [Corallococcus sp. AB011P]|uniref:ELWxxDGT repeat protein n=1 Tax=Corallococcus sp. AB011P TaxID=2316735 RepID=UPI0013157F85|nr:ELWxxDGT repeat protein [Corallococcus sp. AB011P]
MLSGRQLCSWGLLVLAVVGGCSEVPAPSGPSAPVLARSSQKLEGPFNARLQRIKDLRPGDASSDIHSLVGVNDTLFFSATSDLLGPGLWTSNGSAEGPVSVLQMEVVPSTPFEPVRQAAMDGVLYFVARRGAGLPWPSWGGYELWRSDGTSAGTVSIAGDPSTNVQAAPISLTPANGKLFFLLSTSQLTNLWVTDGTRAGSRLVSKVSLGWIHRSGTSAMTALGDSVFFACSPDPGNSDYELCRTDGTSGIVLVKNIYPNSSSEPLQLTAVGNVLFLEADDGVGGRELWKSDGTSAGTVRVRDIWPGATSSGLASLTAVGNTLFFVANDGVSGPELWMSNGTAAGTVLVRDIMPGAAGSNPRALVDVGGTLFFVADDGVGGAEVWKSDGTPAGTVRVKDLRPGPLSSNPASLVGVGGVLFFLADDGGVVGQELWKSDGTEEGTVLVRDVWPGPVLSGASLLTRVGNQLFFVAEEGVTGRELWRSDGTQAGTRLVGNLVKKGGVSSAPQGLTPTDGTLFFRAEDSAGSELWKSDGTEGGTVRVKDLAPGFRSSTPTDFRRVNGTLYFTAEDELAGRELWKSDGTEGGTVRVKDIFPGPSTSGITSLVDLDGTLFFVASESREGPQIWKSDGTEAGTVRVTNFAGRSGSTSYSYTLFALGKTLFFQFYYDTALGSELWKSDGTEAGTVLVKDIRPGGYPNESSHPSSFTDLGGTLFFAATDTLHGRELWKSDGTAEGTVLVKDLVPGTASSMPAEFFVVGDTLYFQATSPATGMELWKSDGTAEGTMLVKDVWPGVKDSKARPLAGIGGKLFFSAVSSSTSGPEVWVSDGTTEGTTRLMGGLRDATLEHYAVWNGGFAFIAATTAQGPYPSLFWTDGTPGSVRRLLQLPLGWPSVYPRNLAAMGDTLFLSADDDKVGLELWSVLAVPADIKPPVVTCPAAITTEATAIYGTRVTFAATATDDVSASPVLEYSHISGQYFPLGTTRVTATAKDEEGNSASCSFDVTVRDTTPPEIYCSSDQTRVASSPEGSVVVYPPIIVWDVGSSTTTTYTPPSGSLLGLGVTPVTIKAVDTSGNTSTCTFNVTVLPPPPPSITCPRALSVEATSAEGAVVNYGAAVATGMAPVTVSYSQVSGTRFALGTHSVTATAVDGLGQMAACSFAVQVRDTTAPALSCPQDVEAEATSAQGALVAYPPASASDAVSSSTVTYSTPSGATFGLGRTAVTITAQDVAGNTSTCTFNVTVLPPPPPSITCPLALLAEATSAEGAVVNYEAAVATGLAPVTVSYSQVSGTRFALGTHSVTATAVDGLGQMAACSFAVQVRDTTAPALSCPQDVEAEATSAQGALVAYAPASASDAVSSSTVTYSTPSGATFGLGRTAVTITAQDMAGNTSTCTFNVTVLSPPAPIPDPVEEEPLPPTPVGPAPSGQGCGAGTNTSSGLGWGLVVLLFWSTHRRVRRSQTPLS